MALKLAASADYWTLSDFVEATIFFGDATTLYPERVKTGTVRLLHGKAPIASAEIDYYDGNTDGSFRVVFLHPSTIQNLSVRVSIETTTGEQFNTKTVVRSRKQSTSGLTPNSVRGGRDREDYDAETEVERDSE